MSAPKGYRRRRVDENHAAIAQAFRAHGWSVQSLADVGKGCPDLVVGRHGVNLLLEVKAGRHEPNDQQRAWIASWRGQVEVVRSLADVVRLTIQVDQDARWRRTVADFDRDVLGQRIPGEGSR